ncbi:hypothetical protein V5799_018321, partial [Amblyomma americanum]
KTEYWLWKTSSSKSKPRKVKLKSSVVSKLHEIGKLCIENTKFCLHQDTNDVRRGPPFVDRSRNGR